MCSIKETSRNWTYRWIAELTSQHGRYSGTPTSTCQAWLEKTHRNRHKHSHYFFRETLPIVRNLGLTEEENRNVESIIRMIKCYVDDLVNETVERRNFHKHMQQTCESFDDYLVSLCELVKTCNFCSDACTNKNICDQMIEGLC